MYLRIQSRDWTTKERLDSFFTLITYTCTLNCPTKVLLSCTNKNTCEYI